MSNRAASLDININQYATFKTSLTLKDGDGNPLSIASWSFSGSIRENFESPSSTNIFFTCSVDSIPSASITLSLPYYMSGLLTQKKYVYDLIAFNVSPNPDDVYRILEGKVTVIPGVTTTI